MITPKDYAKVGADSGVFVFKAGKVVEGAGAKLSKQSFRDTTKLDPDDIARHHRLVRRQHFMDRE